MIQYTTPTFTFDISLPTSAIADIEVTFKQSNERVG